MRAASGNNSSRASGARTGRRYGPWCGLACALWLAAVPAAAQTIDRLRLAPRTGIYVETDYLAADRGSCDWYYPASELLEMEPPAAGDVPCPVVLRLRGTLNRDGARLFYRVTEKLHAWPAVPTRVVLNSSGGDAIAAFQIAQLIRDDALFRRAPGGVTTAIDESETAVCFSACLVVFAAGHVRHARFDEYGDPALPSRLGIHRPGQFDRDSGTYDSDEDNRNIRVVRVLLERFFESVGVDRQLVSEMFAVPFDEIRLLTEDEARDFGLVPARPPG